MRPVRVGTIVKYLKDHGIECMYLSGSYVSLYWRGEDVGNIYQSEDNPPVVRIHSDLAAFVGPNTDAVDIEIDREDWKETLDTAVYHLQGSEERFVDMIRAKRVHNIRRYFEKKKEQLMKTRIGLSSADAEESISKAVKCLKSSPVRYETSLREMRTQTVRTYFRTRKESRELLKDIV